MRGAGIIPLIAGLIALLIVVVYYEGVKTDASSFSAAANSMIMALQGRNSQGNFASYPGHA